MTKGRKGLRGRRRLSRRNGPQSGYRGLNQMNQIVRAPFRQVFNTTVSTSVNTAVVTEFLLTIANMGDRIIDMGDIFAYWRLVDFKAYQDVQPGNNAGTNPLQRQADYVHLLAFIPMSNVDYAAPANGTQVIDFPEAKQATGNRRISITARKSGLIGSMMTKWLTVNTTSSADFQAAGTLTNMSLSPININDAHAAVCRGVFEGVCEFKEPIDSTLVPSSMRQARSRQQRIDDVKYGMIPNRVTTFEGKINDPPGPPTDTFRDTGSIPASLSEEYVNLDERKELPVQRGVSPARSVVRAPLAKIKK